MSSFFFSNTALGGTPPSVVNERNLTEFCRRFESEPDSAAAALLVFTALHVMQTGYSEENSVCPSVRPSVCLSHA